MRKPGAIEPRFTSPLAEMLAKFVREKRACGCSYKTEISLLVRLDRHLREGGLTDCALPRRLVEEWTAKQPHEGVGTQKGRIGALRQFGLFLQRQGLPAYIPDTRSAAFARSDFTSYIFSRSQIGNLLTAVDQMGPCPQSPLRGRVMPEVFRLLYGCGMRVSEVLRLEVADVNLERGILQVRDGKFHHDRLVPVANAMKARLQQYAITLGSRPTEAPFFPAPDGGPYRPNSIYYTFRQLLRRCGIPHGGRGNGPRLHDLRHSFAVHRLEDWYRQGVDLEVKLCVLATYMGHRSLTGTQRYLRLTPHLFPDVTAGLEAWVGHAIPSEVVS